MNRYYLVFGIIIGLIIIYLTMHNQPPEEFNSNSEVLNDIKLTVACPNNDRCEVEVGEELKVLLSLTNHTDFEIGYPLEFRKSSGPSVTLIGTTTQEELQLRTNPANFDLVAQYEKLASGQSLDFEWIVHGSELEGLLSNNASIKANFSFSDDILGPEGNPQRKTLSYELIINKKTRD